MFSRKREDQPDGDWTLDIGLPEGWLILPLREALTDAAAGTPRAMAASELWARETADQLLGADEDADAREHLAEVVVVNLRLLWEAGAIFGAVFLPYPQRGAVEAVARATPVDPGSAADLATARRIKQAEDRALVKPREFREVELPMGPALLMHEVFQDSADDQVIEAVTYYCTVPEQRVLVELNVQWSDLAIGDDLQEHAEVMAESLEYVAL